MDSFLKEKVLPWLMKKKKLVGYIALGVCCFFAILSPFYFSKELFLNRNPVTGKYLGVDWISILCVGGLFGVLMGALIVGLILEPYEEE